MVDIIAFGAHPDDVEFGCGGNRILRLIASLRHVLHDRLRQSRCNVLEFAVVIAREASKEAKASRTSTVQDCQEIVLIARRRCQDGTGVD